jgi:peptidoglycan/xylan/chitin deacetylase (PgdA/CDA1 family)
MRVPVLTYHSNNVSGHDYAANDHVALAEDLALGARLGWRIVPLAHVVDALLGLAPAPPRRSLALSFDDGSWFDWYDLEHPRYGVQRGFAGVLRDHACASGAVVHATSFAIVSPAARAQLDRTCLAGRGWWSDDWWLDAAREGMIAIESHSWDHNHDTLATTAQRDGRRGTFANIATWHEADAEIRQAADRLDAMLAPARATLFAYPYGESNAYLREQYLPQHVAEHRVRAAFTTEAAPITRDCARYALPRYVCGRDWRSPAEYERLLRDCA